jgi:hypothetical protein
MITELMAVCRLPKATAAAAATRLRDEMRDEKV